MEASGFCCHHGCLIAIRMKLEDVDESVFVRELELVIENGNILKINSSNLKRMLHSWEIYQESCVD